MEIWIILTIVSAFLQNMRSVLQKYLKSKVSTAGATAVRFFFGLPFALLYLAVLGAGLGRPMPVPNETFILSALLGALTQIGGTLTLVIMFSFRNFAVGTAYSRTEPAQAALFSLLLLGEAATLGTLTAIAISVAGVMLISVARSDPTPRAILASTFSRTAAIGVLSGALFGLSAVSYRSASLALAPSLPVPDPVVQAGYTLVVVLAIQCMVLLAYFLLRERAELGRIARAWKPALATGFVGATASFGWFTAMTIKQAAVIKALGQVEMLFTFASTVFLFKEKINTLEILGCLLIVLGILALLLI